ncbi:MAG: hypothetical protein IIA88_02470 [Bacteroidetes bacterium]|nr:hypothetical protein [Bacteroidota bacterium]
MKTSELEEDSYLFMYLEKDIEEAKKDIKAGKGLTQKGAMAMLLKGMYNHIAHLNENMVTKKEFNQMFDGLNQKFNQKFDGLNQKFDGKFEGLNQKFDLLKSQFVFTKWLITFGFILLAALQMILAFVLKN